MRKNVDEFIRSLPGVLCYLHSKAEKDPARHLAHCLDFNLMASGASRQAAIEKLDLMVAVYVLTAFMREDIGAIRQRKAAESYWARFFENKPKAAGTVRVQLTDEVSKLLGKSASSWDPDCVDPSTREQFRKLVVRKMGAAA